MKNHSILSKTNLASRWVLVTIFLIIACSLLWDSIVQIPVNLIHRHDSIDKKADLIIILMGDTKDRVDQATELFKYDVADKIIFSESEFTPLVKQGLNLSNGEATKHFLALQGIKENDFIFLDNTYNTSTHQEFDSIFSYIKEKIPEAKRLVIVTSWYHSGRALWIAEKLNQHRFVLISSPSKRPRGWWRDEHSFLMVFNELLKWIYYLIHY